MDKRRVWNICLSLFILLAIGIGVFYHSDYDWIFEQQGTEQSATRKPVVINDLSNAFEIILEYNTKELSKDYPIDQSFLHWVSSCYGEDALVDLAYAFYDGSADAEVWYRYTGCSMHVLWLEYCRDLGYATYYLENVHWQECADESVVTIDFTGDINFADDWHTMLAAAEMENGVTDCISEEIVKELQGADISVVNNEFVFSDGGDRQVNKAYTFRAQPSNVVYLELFGADLANLANNHTYDYRASGLLDTIETLEDAGIATMGAGANLEEAKAIQYYIANGKKIAFVSATEIERYSTYTKAATETEAGVLKTLDPTIYKQVIAEAAENSDYVIASVHWGTEGTYYYSGSQNRLAKIFVEAGADAVIGGHPHRLQGIEYIDGVPVCYSLGNFWFSTGTLYTTIAQIQINDAGELALRMLPCIQQDLKTRMLSQEESAQFYQFMADISKGIAIDQDGYVYNTAKDSLPDVQLYQSGQQYSTYNGNYDLEGRVMDIVGNLK